MAGQRVPLLLLHGVGLRAEAWGAQLETLAEAVSLRQPDLPIHFDLAELRGYNYHTGVLFSALVPGVGTEVARGGRYDEIGNVFGRARPATGFSTDLKLLLQLAETPLAAPDTGPILAPWSDDAELLAAVKELRAGGERVVQMLPGASTEPEVAVRALEQVEGRWVVVGPG